MPNAEWRRQVGHGDDDCGDDDEDGIYVEDFDNDSMVDSDDWTESGELDEVTYWWSNGPQAEVRVGMPFEDARDGLLLGVWRYDG